MANELAELIEQVEKATGPDRGIDALLEIELRRQQAYAVGLNDATRAKWRPVGVKGEVENGGTRYHPPEFTASIDAAVALVERMLPGWCCNILQRGVGQWEATVCLYKRDRSDGGPHVVFSSKPDGNAPFSNGAALALILAILRALQNKDTPHGTE